MNELPRHLVTDLEVNSDGWLISKHEKKEQKQENEDDETTNNHNSSIPPVLHACTKLLALVYSQDDEQNNKEKDEDTNDKQEDDITNLRHVPNIVDQISAVFLQIHKMNCMKPQPELVVEKEEEKEGNEKLVEKTKESQNQDSWKIVGNQDSSNLDMNMEPIYYKEPSERMHLTFNTLQIILPLLQPVMTHKDYNNYELKMKHGPNIRNVNSQSDAKKKKQKRVRKSTVYLLFEPQGVYSTATTKQFHSLLYEYHELNTYMYRFYRRIKGMPYHYDPDTCPNFITSNMLQDLFPPIIPSPQDIIAKTLMTTTDPIMMKFADEMDEKIIHPLALDRYDMHKHHRNSIIILKNRLLQLISNVFKGAVLEVYGSCLSELSLGKSSDVDLSLYIPQMWQYQLQFQSNKMDKHKYQQHVKKTVFRLAGIFRSRSDEGSCANIEFTNCEAIPYARVPVVKGNYLHANNPFSDDGSLHFDICILNDIAVRNSGLLKAYSTMDLRVKMLMLSIKSWIKHHDIGSAADNTLSSYTWMVMVIFYLQCIGFVPNLQCPAFMAKHGLRYDPHDRMHTVNGLKTVYLTSEQVHKCGIWEQPEELRAIPVSCLLAGFFHFYARYFPHETTAISIRLGNLSLQKTVFKSSKFWRFVVEDPFETHDSHCPHDLATPMDEKGCKRVMDALHNAADRMEQLYIDCDKVKDIIGSYKFIHRDSNEEDAADIMDLLDDVTMWDAIGKEEEENETMKLEKNEQKDLHKPKKGRNRNRNKKKEKAEEKKDEGGKKGKEKKNVGAKNTQKKSQNKAKNEAERERNVKESKDSKSKDSKSKDSKGEAAPSPKRRKPKSSLQSTAASKKTDNQEENARPKKTQNQRRRRPKKKNPAGAKDAGRVAEES